MIGRDRFKRRIAVLESLELEPTTKIPNETRDRSVSGWILSVILLADLVLGVPLCETCCRFLLLYSMT